MFRFAAAIILSTIVAPMLFQADLAIAVRSPTTIADYVEAHPRVDWKALRSALALKETQYWQAPCGDSFIVAAAPCSTEIVTVANPDQAIVIIQGGDSAYTVEFLRYLRDPKGGWQFSGENSAYQKYNPSHHEFTRFGAKPFLKIFSDHSQSGSGSQEIEDWFDLTQLDFQPVFSCTPNGAAGGVPGTIGRTISAHTNFTQTQGLERIDLILNVGFNDCCLDMPSTHVGVYERSASAKKFTLRGAYEGLDRQRTIPVKDFEVLDDPFEDLGTERFLVYAFPGLQAIATGSADDDKDWLWTILDRTDDTPEERALQELLTKPSGPARPAHPKPQ